MECRIRFADLKLKQAFESLKEFDEKLYKEICKALNDIKHNVFCGRSVKKKLIPKKLIEKYGIDNLWICN